MTEDKPTQTAQAVQLVDDALLAARQALDQAQPLLGSREHSLVVTKVEEAQLWLRQLAAAQLGEGRP